MTENEALELIEREHNLYPEDSLDSVAWGEVYETFGKLKEENERLKQQRDKALKDYDFATCELGKYATENQHLKDGIKAALKEMDKLAAHKIMPVSFDQSVAIDMCINIVKKQF